MLRGHYTRAKVRTRLTDSFPDFVRFAWPLLEGSKPLSWNWHIDTIGEYLLAWRRREIRNLVINIPFRCMKSLLCSAMYPAWVWIDDPEHQFLTISHGEVLAVRDAVKSRRIITHPQYQSLFGDAFSLTSDQNQKGRYENDHGGYRIALGYNAGGTGEGGDSLIFDDPHDAKKAQSETVRETTLDDYDQKWSNRKNDPATSGQLIIMQRLHHKDLSGHVLSESSDEEWEHLCLPMEYEGRRYTPGFAPSTGADLEDPRTEQDELLWPVRFTPGVVDAHKVRLGSYGTAGQFQQRPSPEGGGILKRKHWRMWPKGKPFPKVLFVLQSYDTAFSEEGFDSNSYSARTTWGVWHDEQTGKNRLLLMEAWRDHCEYPDLRRRAQSDYKDWGPDRVLIEKKASGQSLIQDLRRAKVRLSEYNPDRDKIARAYACQAALEADFIYYPDRKWAEPVIQECEDFPNGEFDDWVDTCTQAWIWFMSHHWIIVDNEPDYRETSGGRGYGRKRAPYG